METVPTSPRGHQQGGKKGEESVKARMDALQKEEKALASHPKAGVLYRRYQEPALKKAFLENLPLTTALFWVLVEDLPSILRGERQAGQRETLRKLGANEQSSPGSLTPGGEEPFQNFLRMSDGDFDRYYQKALRGELKKQ